MRGLFRPFIALIVLGALVGCSAFDDEKANSSWCADWVNDEYGGYCSETWEEADSTYDSDRDQFLPGSSDSGSGSPGRSTGAGVTDQPSVYNGNDLDCEDFDSQIVAQAYLKLHPEDADYLDGDGDGVACEWVT
jgi:hypothetical protein